MIVLFCGSRKIGEAPALKAVAKIIRTELGRLNFATDTIIHGGAIGVDSLVNNEAKRWKFEISVYEPNYHMFGQRAPLSRNDDMARACSEAVGIWDGISTGTKYTVNKVIALSKPVRLYKQKNEQKFELSVPKGYI